MGKMQPLGREDNLIGIESHIDALTPLLSIQRTHEVHIIGIYGMGGIGKMTIAEALFRRISFKFEGSSFIKNVREGSFSKKDVCALQEKILIDVLGTHLKFMIQDPEYGANIIQQRFCNKRVLLVLDDVDDVRQLEFLVGSNNWFGLGSRILITTRDEHLLSDANAKYKPALLRMDQAIELFSRHAFRKNSPSEGYKELSDRSCNKLYGSPSSGLESFRGFLSWKSSRNIACFFKGREVKDVTRILDSFGFHPVIGISVLIEKSLITISNDRIGMHDLIQEKCWQIVRESFKNSRLRSLEEVHQLVVNKGVEEVIEAIVVPKNYMYDGKPGFRSNVFEGMNNLRLLDVNDKFTSHEPSFLSNELRWIKRTCPTSSIWQISSSEKWAAVDRCLSICIPGSKIPSWVREQQNGDKMSLKLRPKWRTQILGFAICCLFEEFLRVLPLDIVFRFENAEMFVPKMEADKINAPPAAKDGDVFINYIPFTCFEQMHDDIYNDFQREDWSHITEGNLVIDFSDSCLKALRCGPHIVYKEDVESIQQTKPPLSSYYWNCKLTQKSANTFWCTY
ncbi:hypothetical protein SSX86_019955 [Deinandra increscens subsp. villosa]|uniref:ADP-ribosyl cyclase/cyclic ADP-ribose hydrolase n=1 Tax=Deinandra increscens subsp. villosa TaxID=3103831 RepID=A0AAP0CYC2_9ASTR